MDLREAAEALSVHYQTAYAWVREGTLPARKVGRGYEVSDTGVQALAALRRAGDEWAAGRVSIAQEHRASAICDQAGAGLVVLSSAMSETARQARQAITATHPKLKVLAGRPGDSLHDLLAGAGRPSAENQTPRA